MSLFVDTDPFVLGPSRLREKSPTAAAAARTRAARGGGRAMLVAADLVFLAAAFPPLTWVALHHRKDLYPRRLKMALHAAAPFGSVYGFRCEAWVGHGLLGAGCTATTISCQGLHAPVES